MDAERRVAELEAELAAKHARIAEQDVRIAEQDAVIAALTKQVAALTDLLGRHSGNSNKPPSSDPPGTRAQRRAKAKLGKRKRGGQPGHAGSKRVLLPVEQVDEVVDHFPPECRKLLGRAAQDAGLVAAAISDDGVTADQTAHQEVGSKALGQSTRLWP